MAFIFDETWVNNGQLIVAEAGVNPKALGEGDKKENLIKAAQAELAEYKKTQQEKINIQIESQLGSARKK